VSTKLIWFWSRAQTARLTAAGMLREEADVSVSSRLFLGVFVLAYRFASVRNEFDTFLFRFTSPLRHLADRRRNIRLGRKLGDELLDLTFGPVRRSTKERLFVGRGEMTAKKRNAAQVKTPVGEHLEKHRAFSGSPRYLDTQVGLVLR
jgi:hypothetical protein